MIRANLHLTPQIDKNMHVIADESISLLTMRGNTLRSYGGHFGMKMCISDTATG